VIGPSVELIDMTTTPSSLATGANALATELIWTKSTRMPEFAERSCRYAAMASRGLLFESATITRTGGAPPASATCGNCAANARESLTYAPAALPAPVSGRTAPTGTDFTRVRSVSCFPQPARTAMQAHSTIAKQSLRSVVFITYLQSGAVVVG